MGEQVNMYARNRNASGKSSDRLTLVEFSDLVHPYVEAIVIHQDDLSTLRALFTSGEKVWDSDCEDAINYLMTVSHDCRQFHVCIERSDHFPLSVVPLRLPLLTAFEDLEAQITKLNRLLVELRNDSWAALDQPIGQVFEVTNELDILELKGEEILDQIRILFDRARFKEREYSIA